MVDIDNDGLFDNIETPDGFYVDDAEQYGLAVSDVEADLNDEGYLAADDNELDHFDEDLGDSYLDDIIDV